MALSAGSSFGHYEVLSLLGAGGMGEVYRAKDTHLDREVAIKVLPADYASNADRLRRFEQEARATSALNHPNILTVHDLGLHEGAPYIVAELLEGEELRAALKRGAIELPHALDYALQVATGLAAAHAKGIVHRDLKPENLFITANGFVKILDFGLAKLRPPEAIPDSEAPTQRKITDPGSVMGTASYMSPEQARGQEVDARSDIFSLGVVLHEMIAGQPPFTGVNTLDVIGAILNQEPAPLRQFAPDFPAELQRIVSKALRKDREQRYQHVKDLLIDLKDLKQELEFEAKLKGFVVPPSGGVSRDSTQPPEGGTQNTQSAETATNEVAASRTTSSAEVILNEIKRHQTGVLLAGTLLVLILAGAVFGLYKLLNSDSPKPSAPFQTIKLTRLTAHGQAVAAAVSPDGKYVVYARQEPAGQSLWLRQVTINNSDVQIAPPKETEYHSFTYSRDGDFIYYVEGRSGLEYQTIYRMSALGRNPTKLLTDRYFRQITLSPDDRHLAFTRTHPAQPNELIVASTDGKDARALAVGDENRDIFHPIAWSPDGKKIACGLAVRREGPRYETVITVNADSGVKQPMTAQRWASIGQLRWLPDGSGLIILASEPTVTSESSITAHRQLWRLSLPGGEALRLTNDLNSYDSLSLTANAGNLVVLQKEDSLSLWVVAPSGNTSRAKQLPRIAKDDGERGIAWTPDGNIVYATTVGGRNGLWLTDADGGGQKQLDLSNGWQPTVSADGRWLAFISTQSGNNDVWRMEFGGGLKQLTSGHTTSHPGITSDGKWVFFAYRRGNEIALWRVPSEGGKPAQLNNQYSLYPALSPDGKLIAYVAQDQQRRISLALMPIEGGPTIKTFEFPTTVYLQAGLSWTPDGRTITYVCTRGGVSNIWGQPLVGGAPKQLTDFKTEQIRAFAWSRDGQLAVSRGVVNSDVVLISEVK